MLRRRFLLGLPALAAFASADAQSPIVTDELKGAMGAFARAQLDFSRRAIAAALEVSLIRSRDAARSGATFPVPDTVRDGLVPFFNPQMLERVHYGVDETQTTGVAGLAIRQGDAVAVTLVDTIIFRADHYAENLPLWAHELAHVEQYDAWGVAGFAARYVLDWAAVEREAEERAVAYVAWAQSRRAG